MSKSVLGIPAAVLVVGCLVVAAVYVPVWPRNRAAGLGGARLVVLRWFHPLAWLLLAAVSGLYGWGGPSSAARSLAGLAGGTRGEARLREGGLTPFRVRRPERGISCRSARAAGPHPPR